MASGAEWCIVQFTLRATTIFGENVCIVGNCSELAEWNPCRAVSLSTNNKEYPVWKVTLPLRAEVPIEYKYIITRNGRLARWEGFQANRHVVPVGRDLEVDDGTFGVLVAGLLRRTLSRGKAAPPSDIGIAERTRSGRLGPQSHLSAGNGEHVANMLVNLEVIDDEVLLDPSKPIESAWRPGEDFAMALKTENDRRLTWSRKVDLIREVFADPKFRPTPGDLAYMASYVHYVNAGEVTCVEERTSFRSQRRGSNPILGARALEAAVTKVRGSDNLFILRKIFPLLPSSTSQYSRPVPLSRIRDIAHHRDTPKAFRAEIKHTLQNKLHRCAGPEDILTSADILRRITAPGAAYPDTFVTQFKIFHSELLEFFNATTLDEQLQNLEKNEQPDPAGGQLIKAFLQVKTSSLDKLVVFQRLTGLREHLAKLISPEDGVDGTVGGELLYRIIIADIRLEEYAFVLLSELVNQIGANGTKRLDKDSWARAICSLGLTVRNVGFGGVDPEECEALAAEIRCLTTIDPSVRSELLRLKASVDRAYRLADDFSQRVLTLFTDRAYRIGKLLNVETHAIRGFCESNIRGHLVFQLSRLLSLVLKEIRIRLQLSPFDALVAGAAVGTLVKADRVDDLVGKANNGEKLVAFVDRANGEEEIPRQVVGIILGHELPHLSHLGVRARQENVVFAVCDDPDTFSLLKDSADTRAEHGRLMGKKVMMEVMGNDTVTLKLYTEDGWMNGGINGIGAGKAIKHVSVEVPSVHAAPFVVDGSPEVVPLSQISPEMGGAKSDGARRLTALSARFKDPLGARFKTVPAVVLPFATLHAALRANPEIGAEWSRITEELGALPIFQSADRALALRDLVKRLPVPKSVLLSVKKYFSGQNVRVMVRSSANVEDLEKVSGAGLYDSVANIDPADDVELAKAIQVVWSSLWNKRATLSRRQAGLSHNNVSMAVLIQEMIPADMSFIMMTSNPINGSRDEVYVELAIGMGETLTSGVRGTPYRLACNKATRDVRVLSFATFSFALTPRGASQGLLARDRVNYSTVRFSNDPVVRSRMGSHLAAIGSYLETSQGQPQDIEGIVFNDEIYLVQLRMAHMPPKR